MSDTDEFVVYNLAVENELRILVGEHPGVVTLELVNGLAEIYGTEMVMNEEYTFPKNSSISVYTWHGCSVKVSGKTESCHVANENKNMILNVIFHAMLEERRIKAETEDTKGPRTMIVGPMDVGKSTLCRILLNYASRLGRRPLFIDLDVGQNSISIPGTIGVLNIERPADIVNGFNLEAVQVYQFGYKSPGHSIILYFLLLKKLGQVLQSGLRQAGKNVRSSGVVINSCGWVRGLGYNAITLAAMSFEIDILCVLEEERLYSQLLRDMPSCVKVIFVPKLDGAIERTRPMRSLTRDARVREYFYGPTNQLQPYSVTLTYSEIKVIQVKSKQMGESVESKNVTLNHVYLSNVPLGPDLINQVLGLSLADKVSKDIVLNHIIGFICVTNVNMEQGTMEVLSPQPSPIPSKIFLMGDIRISNMESQITPINQS